MRPHPNQQTDPFISVSYTIGQAFKFSHGFSGSRFLLVRKPQRNWATCGAGRSQESGSSAPKVRLRCDLVCRAVAVIVVRIVEAVAGAEEEAGRNKDRRNSQKNKFNVHFFKPRLRSSIRLRRVKSKVVRVCLRLLAWGGTTTCPKPLSPLSSATLSQTQQGFISLFSSYSICLAQNKRPCDRPLP